MKFSQLLCNHKWELVEHIPTADEYGRANTVRYLNTHKCIKCGKIDHNSSHVHGIDISGQYRG